VLAGNLAAGLTRGLQHRHIESVQIGYVTTNELAEGPCGTHIYSC